MNPQDELAVIEAEIERRKEAELKAVERELAKRQYKQFLRARYDDWQERYDHIAKTVFDSPWIGGLGYFPHPKQLHFLSEYDIREVFFGGAGAGGKSQSLWFAALQYVHVPGYAALILRRTYADLAKPGALMDRSRSYLNGTAAVWNERDKKWTFPSGATITFGYLQNENDKFQYASAEFQYCAATGTLVLMGDGSYRNIESLKVGEMVETLTGPRPLTRVLNRGVRQCVRVKAGSAEIVVSEDHRLLSDCGWVVPSGLTPTQSHACDNTFVTSGRTCQECRTPSVCRQSDRRQVSAPPPPLPGRMPRPATAASLSGGRIDCESSGGERPKSLPPHASSVRLVLHEPSLRQAESGTVPASRRRVPTRDLGGSALPSSRCGYPPCCGSCGEPLRHLGASDRERIPSQVGVGGRIRACSRPDGRDCIPMRTPTGGYSFRHPYTSEQEVATCGVVLSSAETVPAGEREVWDLTVAGASHYISLGGIVSRNCAFDELTHFNDTQYTFLFSRLRKPSGGELGRVPLRMRSASNPGASGHQWVFERFVNDDTRKADTVYIPSRMDDNPSCNIEEYRESLANVDPITRRQMEHGDWSAVEGGRFKREWFKRWRWADDGSGIILNDHRGPYHFPLKSAPLFATCDPAASASTSADFTVFGVWANTPRGDLVWVDCIRRQVDIPDQPKLLEEVTRKHKLIAIGVEAELSNRAMWQFAERMMLPAIKMTTKGKDKLARAQTAMIHAEAGRIWLPEQSANPTFPVDDVLAELTLFTGTKSDRRDDCVDVLSYGCELREKLGYATMGKQERPGWYDGINRVRGGR